MIIFFFDRFWNPLGKASAKLPKGVTYYDDHEVEDVETGTSTFEVYVGFDEENRNIVRAYGQEATYFVTTDQEGQGRLWSVIDDESDEEAMFHYFYGEDAGMDLINEMLPAWGSPGSAKPIVYYIERAAADSGFEIGINEIPNLTRTLEWDGEATGLNRLQSIFTQFDNAELQFRFDIDENTLALKHKYIDILKKRGNNTGIELRMNREVKNIRMKRSRANMFNAYRCYGATPEGKENPITLNGYSLTTAQKEINPETGKARFVLSGNILKDTESNAKYSRYLNPYEQGEDEGYYTGIYSSEATTQNALANETILQLKKTGYPEVNYEVDVIDAPRTLKAGDNVSIVNDKDELYLEGRILKTDRSRSNDTFEFTLGDYLIRDSGIAEQIQAMADKLKGKDGVSNFIFYAYADDDKGTGFSLNPQGKKYTGLTVSLVNQQPSDPSVYTWSMSKGDDGKKGEPGKSPIITINDDSSLTIEDDEGVKQTEPLKGDPGKGVSAEEISYAISQDGTTPPTSGWSGTRPTPKAGWYMWTRTRFKYTDNTYSAYFYLVAQQGNDAIVISDTAPANPTKGTLWQDSSVVPQIIKVFDGAAWSMWGMSLDNLLAPNILSENGVFKRLEGAEIVNTFSYTDSGVTYTGTTTMKDGNVTIARTGSDGSTWTTTMDRVQGFVDTYKASSSSPARIAQLGQGKLYLAESGVGGYLPAAAVNPASWTNLSYAPGFTTAENNPCQYRKVQIVDGSWELQLRGQIKPTSGDFSTTASPVGGILPVGFRPIRNELVPAADSTKKGARVVVLATGEIQINTPNGGNYVSFGGIRIAL
ncbi:phage tail protein [Enterococcus casseliflavus]|uniref:phage tail protein n=1 Tax=Enterococcus casseliflavus TaxID=37734 RepID=UPI000E4D74EA|nr:phage tail protein [Enterococcus casseliflavus]RHH54934.1 hypothetical protein DW201_10765 [Enterococcus casseliflavus]